MGGSQLSLTREKGICKCVRCCERDGKPGPWGSGAAGTEEASELAQRMMQCAVGLKRIDWDVDSLGLIPSQTICMIFGNLAFLSIYSLIHKRMGTG